MKRHVISLTVSVIVAWLTTTSSDCFGGLPHGFRDDVKDSLRNSQYASSAAFGRQAFWTPYARLYPTTAYAQQM